MSASGSGVGDAPDGLGDVFSLVLAGGFALLLLLATAQLARIFWHRHSKGSFQFLFLVLCIAWMSMRLALLVAAVVLGGEQNVPLPVALIFVWLPLNLEFATYTLLVVFFCQVIYRTQWEDHYKRRFFGVWGVGNVLFLASNIVWIVLACLGVITLESDTAIFLRFLIPGVAFLVLSVLLAVFGLMLQRTLRNPVALVPFKANGSSVTGITLITLLLMLVFVGRTVYNFVIAFETLFYQFFPGELPVYRFLSVLLSEQLPTFSILMFFRHVPRKRGLEAPRLPPALYNSINQGGDKPSSSQRQSMAAGGFLFANPQRYDSDDEDTDGLYGATSRSGARVDPSLPATSSGMLGSGASYGRQVVDDALRSIFASQSQAQGGRSSPLPEVASPSGSYQRLGKSHSSGGSRSKYEQLEDDADDADDVADAALISSPDTPHPPPLSK